MTGCLKGQQGALSLVLFSLAFSQPQLRWKRGAGGKQMTPSKKEKSGKKDVFHSKTKKYIYGSPAQTHFKTRYTFLHQGTATCGSLTLLQQLPVALSIFFLS